MSDEHDSWFKSAFGVDLGQAVQGIEDAGSAVAGQVASTVTQVVQGVQGAVTGAIDDVTGAATAAVKKVAGAVPPSGGGGAGSAGGGTGSFPLGGSVGRGGRNAAGDVRAVQTALGIAADGQCGGQTIAAIEAFQRSLGQARADGRIDANGPTERALASGKAAAAAPPVADAPDGGLLGGLKSLVGDAADAASDLAGRAAAAATDLGGQVVQGAEDVADQALGGGSSGSAAASLNPLPKIKILLPHEVAACHKFLADHKFQAFVNPLGKGKPISGFDPGLDGRPVTFDAVVRRLGPLTLLDPVDELRELVLVRYRELCSGGSSGTSGLLPPNPPLIVDVFAPATLIAKAGPGRVRLLWRGVRGAKKYRVYRSEISDDFGNGPLREIGGTTTFTDTGVTNDVTYHYHVTAVMEGDGESASSPQASATPHVAEGPEAEAEAGPGNKKEGDEDLTLKSKLKWTAKFAQKDGEAHVKFLPDAEIEAEVDQAGNAKAAEASLNLIRAQLEKEVRPVGKVGIEATVSVVAKGDFGNVVFKSAEAEVKAEVEFKLSQISLKAAAKLNPQGGHVEPEFAAVLWRGW
jgi:hypothetical protein